MLALILNVIYYVVCAVCVRADDVAHAGADAGDARAAHARPALRPASHQTIQPGEMLLKLVIYYIQLLIQRKLSTAPCN